jgi:hypothetical protein
LVTAAASNPGSVKSSAAPAASTSVSNAFVCGGGGVTACVTGAEGVEMGHDELDLIARDELEHQRFAYTANVNVDVYVWRDVSRGPSSREEASRSLFRHISLRVEILIEGHRGAHRPYERDAPRGRVRVLRGGERRDQPRRVRLVEDDGAGVERFVEPVHRNQVSFVPGLAFGVPGLQTVAVPVVVRHSSG